MSAYTFTISVDNNVDEGEVITLSFATLGASDNEARDIAQRIIQSSWTGHNFPSGTPTVALTKTISKDITTP